MVDDELYKKEDIEATQKAVAYCLSAGVTGGSQALAGVILHCYNHYDYPLDITELCRLDRTRLAWAWAVLRLRVSGTEPHEILDDPMDMENLKSIYWHRRGPGNHFLEVTMTYTFLYETETGQTGEYVCSASSLAEAEQKARRECPDALDCCIEPVSISHED